jgi:hypothetical protein
MSTNSSTEKPVVLNEPAKTTIRITTDEEHAQDVLLGFGISRPAAPDLDEIVISIKHPEK